MRTYLRSAGLCLGLVVMMVAGCSRGPSADEQFTGLADRYLQGVYAHDPVWATQLGNHEHDGELPDMSAESRQAWVALNHAYQDSLQALKVNKLSDANQADREILLDAIASQIFQGEELREATWNPLLYNPGDAIYSLLQREFAPLPDRLASVKVRLEAIPKLLDTARVNLLHPPRMFTETAITQNQGSISLILDGLQASIDKAPGSQAMLAKPRAEAIAALSAYGHWLEDELLPRSDGDFRLGTEKWRKKLRFSLASDLAPEDILARAQEDLKATTSTMYDLALPLYRTRLTERAGSIDALASRRDRGRDAQPRGRSAHRRDDRRRGARRSAADHPVRARQAVRDRA